MIVYDFPAIKAAMRDDKWFEPAPAEPHPKAEAISDHPYCPRCGCNTWQHVGQGFKQCTNCKALKASP